MVDTAAYLDAAVSLERADLQESRTRVARMVETRVSGYAKNLRNALGGPFAYAVFGGKMLRGFMACESARIHGLTYGQSGAVATAIECIHAYSLVHDDLPCMDDDELRRGQPTVHKKWDDATAVLVGDALQSFAFEEVIRFAGVDANRVEMSRTLARASGAMGMVGGQALDISAETADVPLTLDQITTLQAGKTGALITWSCEAGARMTGQDIAPFTAYGDALGLAFQITDDILDVEGDVATVGKAVGKDSDAGKATFVSLLGLDGAKRRAAELVENAQDALSPYGEDADTLREAAQFVLTRKK